MNIEELRGNLTECGLSNEQIEVFFQLYNILNFKDENSIINIFNQHLHPNINQIEQYEQNRNNKINIGYDFGGVDDKIINKLMFQIYNFHNAIQTLPSGKGIIISEGLIRSLINLIMNLLKYEDQRSVHLHKGLVFHDTGLHLISTMADDPLELGLLMISKAFIEDDMKHLGTDLFPLGHAYQHLNLNKINPMTTRIKNFIIKRYLGCETIFQRFKQKFLNKPTTLTNNDEAFRWLDHIIFFNNIMMKIIRINDQPKKLYDSSFGQIVLSSTLGQICLLIESICKLICNITGTYSDIHQNLKNNLYNHQWQNINRRERRQIKNDFNENNIQNTVIRILNKNYWISNSIQSSFILNWWLRNNIMHIIRSHWFISKNFEKIVDKLLEFFFDFIINH